MCPIGEREQRSRQSVNLRGCEAELRHLQCRSKRTRLPDLGRNVIRYSVRHPRQENNLRERLASDAGQFRSEVIRLLDAVDLVAGSAAVLGHQKLAVRNLLGRGSVEMDVGQQIGIGFVSEERSQQRKLRIGETVSAASPFPNRRRADRATMRATIPASPYCRPESVPGRHRRPPHSRRRSARHGRRRKKTRRISWLPRLGRALSDF